MVPLAEVPEAPHVPGPDHETLLHRQQAFGYTLEDLKYILDADGQRRRGGDRLDGDRHPAGRPLRPGAAAVQLLPAALRPGDQPAARRDPRGAGDLGPHRGRRRGEPAGAQARELPADRAGDPDPRQRRDGPAQAARRLAGVQVGQAPDDLPRRRGGRRDGAAARRDVRAGRRRDQGRGQPPDPLRPRASTPPNAPIPSLLACAGLHHHLVRQGHADPGRPDHRVRRRPRGPPLRPPAGLRRPGRSTRTWPSRRSTT